MRFPRKFFLRSGISQLKTVCKLAYREGIADTLMFDKAHIERGDKKIPKALDREALDKLKVLRLNDLEEEMKRQGIFSSLPVIQVLRIAI